MEYPNQYPSSKIPTGTKSLIICQDGHGTLVRAFRGCPNCLTDKYLWDLDYGRGHNWFALVITIFILTGLVILFGRVIYSTLTAQ